MSPTYKPCVSSNRNPSGEKIQGEMPHGMPFFQGPPEEPLGQFPLLGFGTLDEGTPGLSTVDHFLICFLLIFSNFY